MPNLSQHLVKTGELSEEQLREAYNKLYQEYEQMYTIYHDVVFGACRDTLDTLESHTPTSVWPDIKRHLRDAISGYRIQQIIKF